MRTNIFRAIKVTLFCLAFLIGPSQAQTPNEAWGYYPEAYARKIAVTTALPVYPSEAVDRRMTGLVQARILISEKGEISHVKINPGIDAPLKQATADALCKWTFKLAPDVGVTARSFMSRLTFKFSITAAGPRVELYNPGPEAKGLDHLGHTDTMKEFKDWSRWPEVKPNCNQQE